MIDEILKEIDNTAKEISKSVHDARYLEGCKNMAESCRKIIEKYREKEVR